MTKKWTMPIRNFGKVHGEISIMYEGCIKLYSMPCASSLYLDSARHRQGASIQSLDYTDPIEMYTKDAGH